METIEKMKLFLLLFPKNFVSLTKCWFCKARLFYGAIAVRNEYRINRELAIFTVLDGEEVLAG